LGTATGARSRVGAQYDASARGLPTARPAGVPPPVKPAGARGGAAVRWLCRPAPPGGAPSGLLSGLAHA
jgi:hypothetical protein